MYEDRDGTPAALIRSARRHFMPPALAAVLLLGACSFNSNTPPTEPEPAPQVPDQSVYTPLGFQQYPVDATGKTITTMWISLYGVAPYRGSVVDLTNRDCSGEAMAGHKAMFANPSNARCFNFGLRLYSERVSMIYEGWLSMDQNKPSGNALFSGGAPSGQITELDNGPWYFDAAWKYLIIEVRQPEHSGWNLPPRKGTIKILLDYRSAS